MASPTVSSSMQADALVGQGDPALTNPDLVPTPVGQRRWTWWSYAALWMGMVHNIYNFTWIGGLVAIGMSVTQAFAIAITGNLIQTLLIGLNGRVGARHGIPFAVWARSAFGVYGANVPALIRGLVAIGWFGIQSYLGATAINVLLTTAISPWKSLGATVAFDLPLNLWFAMIIYWAINVLVIRHGMETVRRFESWAGPMIFVVMAVLVVWAVTSAHGLGPIFQVPSKYRSIGSFLLTGFIPGVALYISGSWATMVLNIPDLTRFARSNREQFWGTMLGLPLATGVYYAMAATIVSATLALFGKAFWNPADVLKAINNPALSIVGAALLAIATISVNIPANIVSPAYDLTNLLPRVVTFRRGAVVAIILAFVYMPWRLMQSPETLYGILNNIGAVLGPATGIIIADYFIVRKQRLDIPDLYHTHGRYRAWQGFNLVGLGVLAAGTGLVLLGEFVPAVIWLYEYAWFVGLIVGFVGYLLVVGAIRLARGTLPHEFAPSGSVGEEAAQLARGVAAPGAAVPGQATKASR
jgi:NCS1 family nucleobase:cation symporter-1